MTKIQDPLDWPLTEDPKPLKKKKIQRWVKCPGARKEKFPELLHMRIPWTVIPKAIGEALTQNTVRIKTCRNVRINKIMKIGMFKQALCKDAMSPWMFYGNG